VTEAKVVLDQYENSRRFGFITFQSPEGVNNTLKQKRFFLLGKRINVGPAIKKVVKN